MSYLTSWHSKHMRPIVDGKVLSPETGSVEDAGSELSWLGPPAVDIIWHNMNSCSTFLTTRVQFATTVDKVFVEIAKQIQDGVYSIISVSASAYSFAVICKSEKTREEFGETVNQMRENLFGKSLPLPPVEAGKDT